MIAADEFLTPKISADDQKLRDEGAINTASLWLYSSPGSLELAATRADRGMTVFFEVFEDVTDARSFRIARRTRLARFREDRKYPGTSFNT